jgi:hypothetical protein
VHGIPVPKTPSTTAAGPPVMSLVQTMADPTHRVPSVAFQAASATKDMSKMKMVAALDCHNANRKNHIAHVRTQCTSHAALRVPSLAPLSTSVGPVRRNVLLVVSVAVAMCSPVHADVAFAKAVAQKQKNHVAHVRTPCTSHAGLRVPSLAPLSTSVGPVRRNVLLVVSVAVAMCSPVHADVAFAKTVAQKYAKCGR